MNKTYAVTVRLAPLAGVDPSATTQTHNATRIIPMNARMLAPPLVLAGITHFDRYRRTSSAILRSIRRFGVWTSAFLGCLNHGDLDNYPQDLSAVTLIAFNISAKFRQFSRNDT
jgi:hypothetical protein